MPQKKKKQKQKQKQKQNQSNKQKADSTVSSSLPSQETLKLVKTTSKRMADHVKQIQTLRRSLKTPPALTDKHVETIGKIIAILKPLSTEQRYEISEKIYTDLTDCFTYCIWILGKGSLLDTSSLAFTVHISDYIHIVPKEVEILTLTETFNRCNASLCAKFFTTGMMFPVSENMNDSLTAIRTFELALNYGAHVTFEDEDDYVLENATRLHLAEHHLNVARLHLLYPSSAIFDSVERQLNTTFEIIEQIDINHLSGSKHPRYYLLISQYHGIKELYLTTSALQSLDDAAELKENYTPEADAASLRTIADNVLEQLAAARTHLDAYVEWTAESDQLFSIDDRARVQVTCEIGANELFSFCAFNEKDFKGALVYQEKMLRLWASLKPLTELEHIDYVTDLTTHANTVMSSIDWENTTLDDKAGLMYCMKAYKILIEIDPRAFVIPENLEIFKCTLLTTASHYWDRLSFKWALHQHENQLLSTWSTAHTMLQMYIDLENANCLNIETKVREMAVFYFTQTTLLQLFTLLEAGEYVKLQLTLDMLKNIFQKMVGILGDNHEAVLAFKQSLSLSNLHSELAYAQSVLFKKALASAKRAHKSGANVSTKQWLAYAEYLLSNPFALSAEAFEPVLALQTKFDALKNKINARTCARNLHYAHRYIKEKNYMSALTCLRRVAALGQYEVVSFKLAYCCYQLAITSEDMPNSKRIEYVQLAQQHLEMIERHTDTMDRLRHHISELETELNSASTSVIESDSDITPPALQ